MRAVHRFEAQRPRTDRLLIAKPHAAYAQGAAVLRSETRILVDDENETAALASGRVIDDIGCGAGFEPATFGL